ncbi:MAG: cupin domain-containing protein [Prolixibacteraceae bacterium]
MKKVFFKSEKAEWEDLGAGVSRQIMGYDGKIMLVKVKFEQKAVGAMHCHVHSQTSFVSEGVFEVTIGGQMQILRAGDSFFVPSNEEHGVVCVEAGVLVDNFSPAREDFLK